MKILLTTMVGLEETALKHARDAFGLKGKKLRNGRVIVEGNEEDVVRLNYAGRAFERVMILLDVVEGVETLEDVYRAVKNQELGEFFGPGKTFACRSDRMGEHPFTSLDIERTAGQAVVDYFQETTGKRIRANLANPDVIIRADLDGDRLYIALDTTGYEALHRRGYRVYDHPAALNAALAASMILESEWQPTEKILDPFVGGGTILIEAALWARRVPWFRFRDFLFERAGFFDDALISEVREELAEQENDVDIDAIGIELFEKHIRGAKKNAESAGVSNTIVFKKGDAARLEERADVVVTNPPYGNRIANPRVVHRLYNDFAKRAAELGIPRITTITSRWKWMEGALTSAGYNIEKSKFVLYGKLHTHLIRASLE